MGDGLLRVGPDLSLPADVITQSVALLAADPEFAREVAADA